MKITTAGENYANEAKFTANFKKEYANKLECTTDDTVR